MKRLVRSRDGSCRWPGGVYSLIHVSGGVAGVWLGESGAGLDFRPRGGRDLRPITGRRARQDAPRLWTEPKVLPDGRLAYATQNAACVVDILSGDAEVLMIDRLPAALAPLDGGRIAVLSHDVRAPLSIWEGAVADWAAAVRYVCTEVVPGQRAMQAVPRSWLVATSGDDAFIRLWDLHASAPAGRFSAGAQGFYATMAARPDGSEFLHTVREIGGLTLVIRTTRGTWGQVQQLRLSDRPLWGKTMRWSPSGHRMALLCDRALFLLAPSPWRLVARAEFDDALIAIRPSTMAFVSESQILVGGSANPRVHQFELVDDPAHVVQPS